MAYSWGDYREYLSKKIAEECIFVTGYEDQPVDSLLDNLAQKFEDTVHGRSEAETFVFRSLTYGVGGMLENAGYSVRKLDDPAPQLSVVA